MIVSFVYPSTQQRAGGVTMLYEFANALARGGNEVHFIHGPKRHERNQLVDGIEQIPFRFDAAVEHHIVDTLDDPTLPDGGVIFGLGCPARMGLPAAIVQGFRLIGPIWDDLAFRIQIPKICVASWLVEVGRWYGVPDEQLVHIPVGLDHELFALSDPPVERDIDVAILFHPNPEKGFAVGRDAFEELLRRRPGIRCVVFSMAGKPLRALPDQMEIILDLDQRGLVDEVYNKTKVLMQASNHEGFGLTAIEAMACGAALVTTDCGGSRDYAVPGETALVVPTGDATGLADAVEALLDDDARREAIARAGERFVRNFQWARSAALLEAFLEEYVADPARFQGPLGEDRSREYVL